MIKNEKVIIVGCSGSGKDFLMRKLTEKGLKPCLKWTTRPTRKFEQEGVTYNFVTEKEFKDTIEVDGFFSYQVFTVTPEGLAEQDWYYGITRKEFEDAQLFIMTPSELIGISEEDRPNCFIVYLDINRDVRENRLKRREDKNDSVKRRLDSDDVDFGINIDFDLRITDPEFGADDVYELMN